MLSMCLHGSIVSMKINLLHYHAASLLLVLFKSLTKGEDLTKKGVNSLKYSHAHACKHDDQAVYLTFIVGAQPCSVMLQP